jgi:hypothetical protein
MMKNIPAFHTYGYLISSHKCYKIDSQIQHVFSVTTFAARLVIKITQECLFHQWSTIASDFDNEAITLAYFYFVPITIWID